MNLEKYDCEKSVYGNVTEIIPSDIPTPKGAPIILTTYVDSNLMHDVLTGRSVTGILQIMNKAPIDWYSKTQSTGRPFKPVEPIDFVDY